MTADSIFKSIDEWFSAVKYNLMGGEPRPWCRFGLDKVINLVNLQELFSRKELNTKYVQTYLENVKGESIMKPTSHYKTEANIIYSAHKSFVARHKSRLSHYKDDLGNKDVRTRNTVLNAKAMLQYLIASVSKPTSNS